jgi:hypothetical protein
MRASFITLFAIAIVGIGFWIVFAAWQQQDAARAFAVGAPYTAYNWQTAHAQDRGCEACHGANLARDVSKLVVDRPKPELHGIFATSYGIPMRVEDCLICHGGGTALPFAESIHALHLHSAAFVDMGGNCESCHATVQGKFVLYDDETRYSVLNGVQTKFPTPAFSGVPLGALRRLLGVAR